jgi:hypothetical protein
VTTLLLRALERIHGHLGWLTVAALLHPAILLRNPVRRAPWAVGLATAVACVTGALGATIYPHYRSLLKQRLFIEHPAIGWCFERKEHLAVGAIGFALVGCLAHFAAPQFEPSLRPRVARLAHRSFVAAFAFGVLVGVLGVLVATYRSF